MSNICAASRSLPPALLLVCLAYSLPPAHAQVAPDGVAAGETSPGQAAADGFAGVRGTITDDTGEILISAVIEVLGGGGQSTYSDEDGLFELALPPGTYTLRVTFPMFETRQVEVTVRPGQAADVRVMLPLSQEATEVVVMEGKIERSAEGVQLMIRKNAPAVSDVLSKQEIARTPDSSASDAVKRVPSVTVDEGKYVVIRGLGDRYVSTMLNGASLPSPEPDRQAVPLDLFPTSLLSNLTVAKSYTANLPGTFAGGGLLLDTNAYPADLEMKLEVSTGIDSGSSFRDVNTQPGGSLDFLGYDDGARETPAGLPQNTRMDELSPEERELLGESVSNRWAASSDTAMMNVGVGAEVGDTVQVGGKRLGYLGTFTFGHEMSGRRVSTGQTRLSNGQLQYSETSTSVDGSREATIGSLGNIGYELGSGHSLNLIGLYSHDGEAVSSQTAGLNDNAGSRFEQTRLEFLERELTFLQLSGKHRLARAASLSWQSNVSVSGRDEPDTRDITYLVNNTGMRTYYNEPGSGESFLSSLEQTSLGGGFDVSIPLPRVSLAAGASVQHTERDFLGRRLRFTYLATGMPEHTRLPADQIFSPATIGTSFALEERTLQSDGYDGALDVLGGYASAEVEATDALRAIVGMRFERSGQSLSSGNPTAVDSEAERESIDRDDSSLLPTANLVYSVAEQMNLRTAYSYTLARPMFRELAPFIYYDQVERVSREGNPDLLLTRIHNADVRWEWFPGEREVVAVSGFYKRFQNPIEQVIYNAAGSRTFQNAASANAFGAEVEARMSLGRVAQGLDRLQIGANLALIESSIALRDEQVGSQTSAERPMQGQAPYAVNVSATYSHPALAEMTVLYNVIGATITDVGTQGLPDIYRQPFHKLDVVVQRKIQRDLKVKLAAVNLLDAAVESRQGDLATLWYEPGVSFSLGLEWAP